MPGTPGPQGPPGRSWLGATMKHRGILCRFGPELNSYGSRGVAELNTLNLQILTPPALKIKNLRFLTPGLFSIAFSGSGVKHIVFFKFLTPAEFKSGYLNCLAPQLP